MLNAWKGIYDVVKKTVVVGMSAKTMRIKKNALIQINPSLA